MDVEFARQLEHAVSRAAIDDAARDLEAALRAESRLAARRRLLYDDLDWVWDSVRIRSLWLVTHRGLRRAGFRVHDDSTVVLVAWKGEGLVLVRPPGERRSHALVAWDAPATAEGNRFVTVAAGTPHDTLADMTVWHVLAAHSSRAAGLVRRQLVRREGEEIWIETPEEEPS